MQPSDIPVVLGARRNICIFKRNSYKLYESSKESDPNSLSGKRKPLTEDLDLHVYGTGKEVRNKFRNDLKS